MTELWIWITVGDSKVCPDCVIRHGQKKHLGEWETVGKPGDMATICQDKCRCLLVRNSLIERFRREGRLGRTLERRISTLSRAIQDRLITAGLASTSLIRSDREELREKLVEKVEPLITVDENLGDLSVKSIMELIEIYETLDRRQS